MEHNLGIISTSLVATSSGPERIADLTEPIIGYSWLGDRPLSLPMSAIMTGETDVMVLVETWFGGGCRGCNHDKNVGLQFYVGPRAEFLLKSGDYWTVDKLVPGIRLRVIGRDCGYEEVRKIELVPLESPVPLYSMSGTDLENYALGDLRVPNKVLVR